MKVGAVMAVAAGYPYIALHIWRFVAPGLYKNEKHYVSRFVFVSTALFMVGAGAALFLVYPLVLRFAVGMATEKITPMLQLRYVVNLAAMLMLGFGVMFQLPIIVYLLAVTELVSLDMMKKARPVVVVVIFAASAILTPPDVISQCALGFPSLVLFEISLVLARRALRITRKREEEEEKENDEEDNAGNNDPGPPAGSSPEDDPDPADMDPISGAALALTTGDSMLPDADTDMSPAAPGGETPTTTEGQVVEQPAGDGSWERWYDNVCDYDYPQESAAKPVVQPGDPDPYSSGPAGSGLV